MGPVDPSFRAFSGGLQNTIRRHTFNKDSLSSLRVGRGGSERGQRARAARGARLQVWHRVGQLLPALLLPGTLVRPLQQFPPVRPLELSPLVQPLELSESTPPEADSPYAL